MAARVKKIAEWVVFVVVALVVAALLFVDVGPRFLPYQALVVRSGSMSPTIPTGSIVLYHKVEASQLKTGDVIVFTEPGTTTMVTHRIYSVGNGATGRYFETKGDANAVPDDWRIPAKGTGWESFWHVPVVGYILWDIQTGWTRVLLIVVPALALGLLALLDFTRARRRPTTPTSPTPTASSP